MVTQIKLFEFQEEAVSFLFDETNPSINEKKRIIFKSPTGSGKTLMLTSFIDRYIEFSPNEKISFVWLTPGSGELEEQSQDTMKKHFPHLDSQDLESLLKQGFIENTTVFINWEQINKKNNRAITDSERKNLSDYITDAHREGIKFILIIDEEHLSNTNKTSDIINSFSAQHIIRVSATARKNPKYLWYEVDEEQVIQAGLIKKAMYINEGLSSFIPESIDNFSQESTILLNIANKKRIEIINKYEKINLSIRPLVIIQFPSNSDVLISHVEKKLNNMGFSYENGLLAKWMAEEKININDINNNEVAFLLMKQAISTGWDCPRSHILIKLRENMEENFEIQTIGRIRRMPQARHYNIKELDSCYLYTLDKKYKETVLGNIESAYEIIRLKLKGGFTDFSLIKENRDLDFNAVDINQVFKMIAKYFREKYSLGEDFSNNLNELYLKGYNIDHKILGNYVEDKLVTTEEFNHISKKKNNEISFSVDTHVHGLDLMHSIDALKKIIHISHNDMRTILEALFAQNNRKQGKILRLSKHEWYAFIINNLSKLKEDFSDLVSGKSYQLSGTSINPKTTKFQLPKEDYFKYDSTAIENFIYTKNVYKEYNSSMTVNPLRSTSEQLFEQYCEDNYEIEWFYKNGDSGKEYISIIYLDVLNNQWLFYPDYIVKHNTKGLFIIETKGGEIGEKNKNIDKRAEIKFDAFKKYAEKYNINWGFVRDKNSRLYMNNSVYNEKMNSDVWLPIINFLG